MAKDDGSEMVTWTGHDGIGHQLERRRDIGSIFCRTSSTTGNNLAFLNNIVGVFEYDADEKGNSEKYGSGNRTLTSYNSVLYHSLFFIIWLSVFHTNYYLHVVNYTKIVVIICLFMESGVTDL